MLGRARWRSVALQIRYNSAFAFSPTVRELGQTDGEAPVEFHQAPVCFGEHNDYVYRELLGMSEQEIAKLEAAGHITDEYDKSVG